MWSKYICGTWTLIYKDFIVIIFFCSLWACVCDNEYLDNLHRVERVLFDGLAVYFHSLLFATIFTHIAAFRSLLFSLSLFSSYSSFKLQFFSHFNRTVYKVHTVWQHECTSHDFSNCVRVYVCVNAFHLGAIIVIFFLSSQDIIQNSFFVRFFLSLFGHC